MNDSSVSCASIMLSNRRILIVHNVCLISISDTVSDGATKMLALNTLKFHSMANCPKEFEPDVLNTFCVNQV